VGTQGAIEGIKGDRGALERFLYELAIKEEFE
jgi:hypothetical protein